MIHVTALLVSQGYHRPLDTSTFIFTTVVIQRNINCYIVGSDMIGVLFRLWLSLVSVCFYLLTALRSSS